MLDSIQKNNLDYDVAPWYRQPWAWFIIAPLIAVVCSSSVLVYLAVVDGDDVVMDNYYKEGRLINQRLEQDLQAQSLNIKGQLDFDLDSGEVFLSLYSDGDLPAELLLLLNHPASADLDQQLTLRKISDNRYRGDLESVLRYRWYLRLLPELNRQNQNSAKWRLLAEIDFERQHAVAFSARH